ncbi:Microtubule-associated proteins 1A/1B light chain 3C, partial [Fragariocoptes setiger]
MAPTNAHNIAKPYKQRKSFEIRRDEVNDIRKKFPNKIPVVVERYQREINLPLLDKVKFLVPQELTMSNFTTIIRNRLQITSNRAFYFIINNKSMASTSKTMAEIYRDNKDEDGFLYMTYASQEMFGDCDDFLSFFSQTMMPPGISSSPSSHMCDMFR